MLVGVLGLSVLVKEDQVRDLFGKCGTVNELRVYRDSGNTRQRTLCVKYDKEEDGQVALHLTDQFLIDRLIRVQRLDDWPRGMQEITFSGEAVRRAAPPPPVRTQVPAATTAPSAPPTTTAPATTATTTTTMPTATATATTTPVAAPVSAGTAPTPSGPAAQQAQQPQQQQQADVAPAKTGEKDTEAAKESTTADATKPAAKEQKQEDLPTVDSPVVYVVGVPAKTDQASLILAFTRTCGPVRSIDFHGDGVEKPKYAVLEFTTNVGAAAALKKESADVDGATVTVLASRAEAVRQARHALRAAGEAEGDEGSGDEDRRRRRHRRSRSRSRSRGSRRRRGESEDNDEDEDDEERRRRRRHRRRDRSASRERRHRKHRKHRKHKRRHHSRHSDDSADEHER